MDEKKKCHALIFGASGLAGWAVVDQLLSNYPAPGTFSTVTALLNCPLIVEDPFLPVGKIGEESPKFDLISGVYSMKGGVDEFAGGPERRSGMKLRVLPTFFILVGGSFFWNKKGPKRGLGLSPKLSLTACSFANSFPL